MTMAARITRLRSQYADFETALHSFTSSPSKFGIVQNVNPAPAKQLKTLYILDSSFNPPSNAHLTLITSALKHHALSRPGACRLLLLFSTHNADKSPSPASFAQRIALMTIFAEDMSQSLKNAESALEADIANISIDVGLTKEPYYTDKSVAITASTPPVYPSEPVHVHLVGYDTFVRFCNPKYYPHHDPPLTALKPYFESGHRLHVTQRPMDPSDESSKEFGTLQEQEKYLQGLRDGEQEQVGFEPAWGKSIEMMQAGEGIGVSSTRVRTAAKEGRWDEVSELCTDGVAAWIKDQGLYCATR